MAVAFVNYAEAFASTLVRTSFDVTTLTIAAGSNLVLIAKASFNNGTGLTTVSCTWGGQTMEFLNGGAAVTSGSSNFNYFFGLVNPTPGNQTLTLHHDSTGTNGYLAGEVYSGVNQAGGAASFANFNSIIASTGSPTLTVTSAVGNMVTTMAQAGGGITFNTPWIQAPATGIWLDGSGNLNSCSTYADGASSVVNNYNGTGTFAFAIGGFDLVTVPDNLLSQIWM